ncbi:MAG: hypothetical protein DI553_08970, partial [Cutibacterium acnes]
QTASCAPTWVPHRAQNILISIHEWLLKNMASSHQLPSLWRYRRNAAVISRPAFSHISNVDQALPQQPLGATFRHLCGSSR